MRRVLVFQHVACEHPGRMRALMRERGITYDAIELDAGEAIPSLAPYDALMVFGGPMNVDETVAHPWLVAEVRAIREALDRELPILGICLGAQLLAKALGAPVSAAPVPEIGTMPVTLTPAGRKDPLFSGLPREFTVFQWHGDRFALPDGAVQLASSPGCSQQAFCYGERAYGLQFHIEIEPQQIDEWAAIEAYRTPLERLQGPGAVSRLRESLLTAMPDLQRTCLTIFEGFLQVAAFGEHHTA